MYGQKYGREEYFQAFVELDAPGKLSRAHQLYVFEVNQQILQTVNILVLNLQDKAKLHQLFASTLVSELIIGYNKTCRGGSLEDVKPERAGTMAVGDSSANSAKKDGLQDSATFDSTRPSSMSAGEQDSQFNSQLYTDQYIAFLKQVSLNLSPECIASFFNPDDALLCTFPLYQMAIKFYNHQDSLVKTSI